MAIDNELAGPIVTDDEAEVVAEAQELGIEPQPETAPPAWAKAEPVAPAERVGTVDVIRGFALLGILLMNIVSFGWPAAAYDDPTVAYDPSVLDPALARIADPTGFPRIAAVSGWLDLTEWSIAKVFFAGKMMTTFSMLFGAGLVLMTDRADARGKSLRGVYYRRSLWLMVIGALHGYFVWGGDILYMYGGCALLLYLFRRWSAPALLTAGVVAMAVIVPLAGLVAVGVGTWQALDRDAEAMEALGQPAGPIVGGIREFFEQRREEAKAEATKKQAEAKAAGDEKKADEADDSDKPSAVRVAEEINTYRGGWWGIVKDRAETLFVEQTLGLVLGGFLFIGGRMLIGMALMKWGIFAGTQPYRIYMIMALIGYGLGLPMAAAGAGLSILMRSEGMLDWVAGPFLFEYFAVPLVALGHIATLVMICKAGWFLGATRRLAAVGRMALSNYLTHSIVCSTLFYGYGFGLFGSLPRTALLVVVFALWAFQLAFSPWWLARFRYGPVEWLWRTLTYGKIQPFRYASKPAIAFGVE